MHLPNGERRSHGKLVLGRFEIDLKYLRDLVEPVEDRVTMHGQPFGGDLDIFTGLDVEPQRVQQLGAMSAIVRGKRLEHRLCERDEGFAVSASMQQRIQAEVGVRRHRVPSEQSAAQRQRLASLRDGLRQIEQIRPVAADAAGNRARRAGLHEHAYRVRRRLPRARDVRLILDWEERERRARRDRRQHRVSGGKRLRERIARGLRRCAFNVEDRGDKRGRQGNAGLGGFIAQGVSVHKSAA